MGNAKSGRRYEWGFVDSRMALLIVALVFTLGVAADGGARGLVSASVAVLLVLILKAAGLTLFDISIAVLPVMFYVSFGVNYNVSAGDILLPVLAIQASRGYGVPGPRALAETSRGLLGYLLALLLLVCFSAVVANLANGGDFDVVRALAETSKLAICAVYALVYFVLAMRAIGTGDLKFVQVWAWASTAVAGLSSVSLLVEVPGFEPYSELRASGSFEDPNLLATYLLCSLGVTIAYNMRRALGPIRLNVLVLILGVISSGSRAGLIVLAVGLAAFAVGYLLLYRKVDLRFVFGLCLGAVSSPLWAPFVLSAGGRGSFSLGDDGRFMLWDVGLDAFKENVLLGIGYGQFPILISQYLNTRSYHVIHNTFLSFFVETGVIGGTLVVGGLLVVGGICLRHSARSFLASGWSLGLILLAGSLLSINGQNVRFVWVFVAIALAVGVSAKGRVSEPSENTANGGTGNIQSPAKGGPNNRFIEHGGPVDGV